MTEEPKAKPIPTLDPNERAQCERCKSPNGEPRLISDPLMSFGDDDDDDDDETDLTKRFICAACAARGDHGMWLMGLVS